MAVTRRDLLRCTAALAGSACLCSASDASRTLCCITPQIEPGSLAFTENTISIDLDAAASLAEPGSSVNIIDPARRLDLIVVHAEKNRFAVLSGLCTHAPRPLTYIPQRGVLQCNNFNHSIFSLTGEVIKSTLR